MYSQDWVDHMKQMMEVANPGDAYEVVHIYGTRRDEASGQQNIYLYGGCYVKTEAGYRSCHIGNVEITGIKQAPFRI